jgi:hypothetical protein
MPLVDQWHIPLVCTDPWVYTCAQLFYPPAEIILATAKSFQDILSGYETFVSVEPCRLHHHALQFGEFLYRGKGETIAGFHGNPQKFRHEYWIERYVHENHLLVYGDYLIDYLKEKGVWDRLTHPIFLGNIRKKYYEKNKIFFDRIAEPHLFSSGKQKTILWAPTWSYPQWPNAPHFLENIPEMFQILVKLHPFMYRLYPEKVAEWKERYTTSNQILFMEEIPLIYPFIEQADFYIGDYSSVAYDFLSNNNPLFLLGDDQPPWATKIARGTNLFSALMEEDKLSEIRKKTYSYVWSVNERYWNTAG